MTRLFLVGCYFHWDWQAYWIWVSFDSLAHRESADLQSGFLLWFADRLISLARMVAVNKLWLIKSESAAECGQATIEMLDGEVMRLTMKRDLDWQAGQHVYVLLPLALSDSSLC
jgi:hypothetical protein